MRTELVLRFDYGRTVPWVSRLPDGTLPRDRRTRHGGAAHAGRAARREPDDRRRHFDVAAGEHGASRAHARPVASAAAGARSTSKPRWKRPKTFWADWAARNQSRGEWSDAVTRSLITLKALTYAPTGGMVAAPDDVAAREARWRAQLGLSLLLAARRDAHAARADERRLLRRSAGVARLAAARRRRRALAAADHVRPRRRASSLGIRGAVAAGLRAVNAGSDRQRRARTAAARRVRRSHGRALSGQARRTGNAARRLGISCARFSSTSSRCGAVRTRASGKCAETLSTSPTRRSWRGSPSIAASGRSKRQGRGPGRRAGARFVRRIHAEVCARGFDRELGSFVQSYGSKNLDASLLLMPTTGFLPADDPRIRGTIEAVERHLFVDGFVLRYDTHTTRRRACRPARARSSRAASGWRTPTLLSGRQDDARRCSNGCLALRNDVGLLAEEYDTEREAAGRQLPAGVLAHRARQHRAQPRSCREAR